MQLSSPARFRSAFAALLAALLVIGGATASPADAQTVSLKPKLVVGKIGTYRITTDGEMTQEVKQMSSATTSGSIQSSITVDLEITSLERIEDDRVIPATGFAVIRTCRVVSDMGGQRVVFDSEKQSGGQSPAVRGLITGLIGQRLDFELDREGNITAIRGLESAANSAASQVVGPATMTRRLSNVFSVSNRPSAISVGDSWEDMSIVPLGRGQNSEIRSTHTLRSVSGNVATVEIDGSINARNNPNPSGVQLEILDSSYRGDYKWDTSLGRLRSMRLEQSQVLQTSVSDQLTLKITSSGATAIELISD